MDSSAFLFVFSSFLLEIFAQGSFNFAECTNGVKICVLNPPTCVSNGTSCIHGASIKQTGAKTLEIELFANNLSQLGWMAVAFQGTSCQNIENTGGPCMANTPVTECSWTQPGKMTGNLSYNDATPQNIRINNVDILMRAINFTTLVVQQTDAMTYCKISQMVTGAPLTGVIDADKVYQQDPSKNYSILIATGPGNGQVIQHHTATYLSAQRYPVMQAIDTNATTISTITPPTTPPPATTTPAPLVTTTKTFTINSPLPSLILLIIIGFLRQ